MKTSLFRKTARTNIKKNYRFFVPRILAEIGLLACFYIAFTLAFDERIKAVEGGAYVTAFMQFASLILGLLSAVIMIYANSFLMKQRKREFGLYNVLGMEKRHIGRILFHENLTSSIISVAAGCVLGILMYKISSLLVCKLLKADVILGFDYIKPLNICIAAGIFLAMDFVIFLIDRISIARMKPVDLLKSRSAGEKEPRVKVLILVLGIICLGSGYAIAIIAGSPLSALSWFFPAVFLVIFGTYFLITAGSVFVLKALKKNKNYYYNKKHFVSVSGLLYRMKQNAVGLASIAILATGVLVMISSTVSLYSSMDDTIAAHYPDDAYISASYSVDGVSEGISGDCLIEIAENAANSCGLEISSATSSHYLDAAFMRNGTVLGTDREKDKGEITDFKIITEEMYRRCGGEALNLLENEAAICTISGMQSFGEEFLEVGDMKLKIAKQLSIFPVNANLVSAVDTYGLVVSDEDVVQKIYEIQKAAYGKDASEFTDMAAINFADREAYAPKDSEVRKAVYEGLLAYVNEVTGGKGELVSDIETVEAARIDVIGMYGAFLFLGIVLGLVCLFATALIVYYKQISEGYEDRERFQIMKKVGMSDGEIKKSIRSQIRMVFFLPLAVAGIHMCFAFPMLEKMMHFLLLSSVAVFIQCSVVVFLAFALVYVTIYSVTAKSYYKIIR